LYLGYWIREPSFNSFVRYPGEEDSSKDILNGSTRCFRIREQKSLMQDAFWCELKHQLHFVTTWLDGSEEQPQKLTEEAIK
jgi:hypothetical protein